jgi:tetratricopeptide (TPR) repeat protein
MNKFNFLKKIISVTFALWGLYGCAPDVMLPPVYEPLDSIQWKNCASTSKERQSMSLIDDLTLDSKTLICEGVVLANSGETEKGLELLMEAAVRNKTDHRPHYLSGRILANAGRYEEALTEFERSQKRFPDIKIPARRLGEEIFEKKGIKEATLFLEKTKERNMCRYECQGLLADLYLKAKRPSDSEKIYKEMITLNPDEPAAYIGLARIYNVEKNFLEESNMLTKATLCKGFLELSDSRKSKIYYSHSFSRYNAKKYKGAAKAIDRALAIEQYADWWLLAGWIQLKLKNPAVAIVKFDKAISMDKKLSPAFTGKGDALLALGQLDDAAQNYEKASYFNPSNAVLKLKLALVKVKQGDLQQAKNLLDEAMRMDKDHLPEKLLQQIKKGLKKQMPDTL